MNCPEKSLIQSCLHGRLTEVDTEQVFRHVEGCPRCSKIVDRIESEPISLKLSSIVADSRQSNLDEACRKLISRASDFSAIANVDSHDKIPDLSGTTIRDYELRRVIGVGGMGKVYLAWHRHLKRKVALKVISKSSTLGKQEFEAIGKLNHQHIIRALDAGEQDGTLFLVMDLVDGVDAAELCRQHGPLPTPEACRIIEHVARGLDYAHANGLIHRDVKPSNIMVTTNGKSLLMDLGLALMDAAPNHQSPVVGTAHYVAPEQTIDSLSIDEKADVYSLGCTLYHFLAGHPPFAELSKDTSAILDAHRSENAKSLAAVRKGIPEDIVGLVHRMISKSKTTRPTIRMAVEALAPFAEGSDVAKLVSTLDAGQPREDASYSFLSAPVQTATSTNNFAWTVAAAGLATLMFLALWSGPWTADDRQMPGQLPRTVTAHQPEQVAFAGRLEALISSDAETEQILFFSESVSAAQRTQLTISPGNEIVVTTTQPPDAEQGTTTRVWDLLELKVRHPELFKSVSRSFGSSNLLNGRKTISSLDKSKFDRMPRATSSSS